MLRPFAYTGLPARVVFGEGALGQVATELARIGVRRPMIVCTPGRTALARDIAQALPEGCASLCDLAVMHTPLEIAQAGRRQAADCGADGLVSAGGGSTIGLAKAIALTTGLPILAVPTTYSGSEMTPVQGITESGVKVSHKDARMLPRAVVYDPALLRSLPAAVAGPSGMNAIAHAVEALYARDANPITASLAQEGIRRLAEHLPAVVQRPQDMDVIAGALYGACLSGMCLAAVGMALHHKLCHTLGGSFNLPHAQTHAIVLPHAAAYNREAVPEAMAGIARALRAQDAAGGLFDLARRVGAPASLREIGMPESGLDRAAEIATLDPYWNPRPVDRASIRGLLQRAWEGARP